MKTSDMTIAELWKAHWANPNNATIRNAIALRDPRGAKQLWPISNPCGVQESRCAIHALEYELSERPDPEKVEELEEEISGLESQVEELETERDELKEKLAAAVSE